MDVHTPKQPVHGWRELAKEVGIIVIGVLIALGAEQAVEWLHWRAVAARAEGDLRLGAQISLASGAERVAVDGCLRARTAELRDALLRPGAAWRANPQVLGHAPLTVLPEVYRAPDRAWPREPWDAAIGLGVLVHLPREHVRLYALLYDNAAFQLARQNEEQDLEPQLAALAFDRDLTPEARAHYLDVLARLDKLQTNIAQLAIQMLQAAETAKIRPAEANLSQMIKAQRAYRGACVKDITLPLKEAP